ncbi:PLP-dependent transferase [Meira miltonrushii]|uniref:PLP-dependent transferase n=1 Tax=Meira miltonrushii TaxID=1280837 RepID=A0A316VGF8_9BASI|nr:PLP-dependent transferase [Meira miltonrushii]PWN36719.1 PLP-dependent transferase [Meira miltonrushii]
MRKPARDNPWATGSPVPEANDDQDDRVNATAEKLKDLQTASNAAHTDIQTSKASQQKYSLTSDEREGDYDLPKLGKPAARYFNFKPGYLNLNNGSYGACPQPVMEYVKQLLDQQEETPDNWRYNVMGDLVDEAKASIAKIVNAEPETIALIQNASTGTNAVLRDMIFKDGDAILTLSCTYGAVNKTIDYVLENERLRGINVTNEVVSITLPCKHEDMLAKLRESIASVKKAGKKIRIGVVDTIFSRPGVRLPWEEMVAILRENGILSLVDGAHGIGAIPIDLKKADPDFFVSNCHKWLYAHRSNAFLYVPLRNRHIQRSGMPTSFCFTPNATSENNTWSQQWMLNGTTDMSVALSVQAAIQFRQKLGGEARIMNYNHDLAVRGGEEAAKILGTSVMDNEDHSLTASMVNIRLPIISSRIANGNTQDPVAFEKWAQKAESWFFKSLFEEFKCAAPVFAHDGKIWVRMSAQIWLDIDDFKYCARALLDLCKRINEGQVTDLK